MRGTTSRKNVGKTNKPKDILIWEVHVCQFVLESFPGNSRGFPHNKCEKMCYDHRRLGV